MENNYKKIVVAVDGSDAAEKAFNRSVDVAKRNDAELIIAHVVDTRSFATIEAYDAQIYERAEEEGKKLLADYEQTAKAANIVKTKTVLKHGSPKAVIPKEIIPEEEADLIMIAATGLNAVERFVIGSVSERTARYAECDVLIVK